MGAAGVGLLGAYQWQKEAQTGRVLGEVRTVGRPALGGPFVLVDHAGRPLTDAAYRGRFALLYFGFTYCPDICESATAPASPPLTRVCRSERAGQDRQDRRQMRVPAQSRAQACVHK